MFWMDKSKVQGDEIPSPGGLPPDVIISTDTQRAKRIPPGQSRTRKWPVLDASGPPSIDLNRWHLRISGLVGEETEWNWEQFLKLPRTKVFADFHCVTRWSRLGNVWEGVSTRELMRQAGGVLPGAAYVMAYGYDRGWTPNLPLATFLPEAALVALQHDGEPITADHGGPARLIVPQLYAWKSAKWLAAIEVMDRDSAGFAQGLAFWNPNGKQQIRVRVRMGGVWVYSDYAYGWE